LKYKTPFTKAIETAVPKTVKMRCEYLENEFT